LNNCTIQNNVGIDGGGVLCNHGGSVSGGSVSRNHAAHLGGGISYSSVESSLEAVACTGNFCGYMPPTGWHLVQDVANIYDSSLPYIVH